jgi:hypothetical protein
VFNTVPTQPYFLGECSTQGAAFSLRAVTEGVSEKVSSTAIGRRSRGSRTTGLTAAWAHASWLTTGRSHRVHWLTVGLTHRTWLVHWLAVLWLAHWTLLVLLVRGVELLVLVLIGIRVHGAGLSLHHVGVAVSIIQRYTVN